MSPYTRPRQPPNQPLRRLLAEAGWTGARLAREINAEGAQQGWHLTYDRTAVAHWLKGTRPRSPAPELAAEVLTRALGRPVNVVDIGLNPTHAAPIDQGSVPWGGDVAAMLEHLDQPPGQGSVTRSGVYSLTSLTVPTWPAQGTSLSASKLSGREVPVGPEQISVCQTLLSVFSQNDAAFGAGSVLEPLRRFLATSVTDWLRAPAEPRFRRELCTATAQMAYLCAFAHFDSNLHPQAQQYYLASLSLAHEGGDRAGYAVGLRGLSVQAHALGHFQHADRLATQAVHLGIPHASPPQQAFLLGQLAVTRAVAGDLRASNHHLSAAEQRLESAHSAWAPVGAYHPASLALQHATVARGLHDHQRAVRELQLSLRYRPEGENRSRAITLAHLAEAQLSLGHLDLACHTWAEFLALYPQIASARADDLLKSQVASLRPHRRNRTAGSLLEQALYLRQLRYRS